MAYKLLLADDSITIQKVVELTLAEEGFDVTAVGDGAAAVEAAGKLMPDIILADVFMPKMDGYQLCQKIKSDPRLSGVPVMLLTGTFEEYDEQKAASVGADDRLTKPFESAELISKVRQLVETGAQAPAAESAAEPVAEPEAEQEPELEAESFAAEEAVGAEPGDVSDDLWNVVDMASEEQPLTSATEVMTEEDLWKRANLVSDAEEAEAVPEDAGMSFEDLPVEAAAFEEEGEEIPETFLPEEVVDEAEVEPYAEPSPADEGSDRTAILNMEDIQSSVYAAEPEEVSAIEVAEVGFEPEIMTFDSLGEATEAAELTEPAMPATRPAQAVTAQQAPPAMSEDAIRAIVEKAAGPIIEAKIKEALKGVSAEMIEKIVWDVVPELAEEIIQKEVDRIKAG
jgi:CheY-like chemotaxis protein